MKKIILTLFLSLCTSVLMAQGDRHPRFSPEEFRAKLEAYITQKANLSSSEAEKFFPIFHEMKNKQREIMGKVQELKRKHPASNATEKEYATTVQKIAELEANAAKVEVEYYKRICKVVSAKKVYSAILADDSFHREMLQRFDGNKRGDKRPKQKD